MKKNGFTLIELLAVIVILGLLSVVIIPKVVNSVRDSKKKSYEVSVNGLVDALNSMAIDKKATLTPFDGCVYNFDGGVNTCAGLEFSGVLPDSGSISVDSDGNVSGFIEYDDYEFVVINNREYETKSSVEFTFDYTGAVQEFTASQDGLYKIEVWGAQGGKNTGSSKYSEGGFGGYSVGYIVLTSNSKIYLQVGGKGSYNRSSSYNGGGFGQPYGGGASSVTLVNRGQLSAFEDYKNEVIMVAGGGGGDDAIGQGGHGGGFKGGQSYIVDREFANPEYMVAYGGTQTDGGSGYENGSFGQGGGFSQYAIDHTDLGGSGGGGYYGGGSGKTPTWSSGGGGSGYIGNPLLTNKFMYCYDCEESSDLSTFTISTTGSSSLKDTANCPDGYSENPVSKCAKAGNGYAKITYLGE